MRTRRTKEQIRKDNYNRDVDAYNFYVVNLDTMRAETGFEFKEDAVDLLNDYDDKKKYKVVSKRALKSMGIENPNESFKYEAGGDFQAGVYAKGGGLESHGIKQGDTFLKTISGGIQQVKDKNGNIFYINLATGERSADIPLPFANGGEIRRFDRHAQMDSSTREEIMDVIQDLEIRNPLTNYLYGLFDGYDYSKTKNFKIQMNKLRAKDFSLHKRVKEIYSKIDKYKFEKYNDFDEGGEVTYFINKDGIRVRSKVEPKEKLSEREWMAKHNESKEARSYAFGGFFGKSDMESKPKKINLNDKQVRLNSGEYVQVLDQDGDTLMVMELSKIGTGASPKMVKISDVDMTSFATGGSVDVKKGAIKVGVFSLEDLKTDVFEKAFNKKSKETGFTYIDLKTINRGGKTFIEFYLIPDKTDSDVKIKDWYMKNYPTDDLGKELNDEVTFEDMWNEDYKKYDIYEVMGVGDSLIRERLFEHLAEIKGVSYDVVYRKLFSTDGFYASGGGVDLNTEVILSENRPNGAVWQGVVKPFMLESIEKNQYTGGFKRYEIDIYDEVKREPTKEEIKQANEFFDKIGGRYADGGGVGLIGNQSKIDMNKNGRIDAEDFEIMRNTMDGAWRKERKYVNSTSRKNGKVIDYEVRYARKNNPSRKGYKGKTNYADGGGVDYGIPKEDLENYKIVDVIKKEVTIDYDNKEQSKFIILAKPILNNYKNKLYEPKVSIVTKNKNIYTIDNVNSTKWNDIKQDIDKNNLSYRRYGYFKILLKGGAFEKNVGIQITKYFDRKKGKWVMLKDYIITIPYSIFSNETSFISGITGTLERDGYPVLASEWKFIVVEPKFAKGGAFEKLSNRVARNYEGKRVKPQYQKEYGKVYSKEEAKEVGDKVAGKVKANQKMATGGATKKGGQGAIMILAKKIRKDGEKWTDAVKRAGQQLK